MALYARTVKAMSHIGLADGRVSNLEQTKRNLAATLPMNQQSMEPDKSSQTILVVDDDYDIRKSVKALLEIEGYAVLVADDAEAAIKLYDQAKITLLLSDVVMPKISGPELADQLLRREPQLRILFMSGTGGVSRGYGCLAKPFTRAELISRVGQTLKSRAAAQVA
jgi:DNA-binding NtrC family response regulator